MELDSMRLEHCLKVGHKMKAIALERYPGNEDHGNEMFILGMLHDIGYEFSQSQEEHPTRGGELLKQQNYKYWREIYYHGKMNCEYSSEELEILNIADMLIDAKGNEVTAQERLKDISERYGNASIQFIEANKLAEFLKLI